jgi:hypothetical protein
MHAPYFSLSRWSIPVLISFSEGTACYNNPTGWRVARGTVLSISVTPGEQLRPEYFGVDLEKYSHTSTDIVDIERYWSAEEGVTLSLFKGYVSTIGFFPSAAEEKLRCAQPKKWLEKRFSRPAAGGS